MNKSEKEKKKTLTLPHHPFLEQQLPKVEPRQVDPEAAPHLALTLVFKVGPPRAAVARASRTLTVESVRRMVAASDRQRDKRTKAGRPWLVMDLEKEMNGDR